MMQLKAIFSVLLRRYDFEMAQQAPAMAMMLRGIRIDTWMKAKLLDRFQARITSVDPWDGAADAQIISTTNVEG